MEHATVDFDIVMAPCYTEIPVACIETMVEAMPGMLAEIRRTGKAGDVFMDSLHIMKLNDHFNRDGFTLW